MSAQNRRITFEKTTGLESTDKIRDEIYFWQLWHHNWDDCDIDLSTRFCSGGEKRIIEIGCGDGRISLAMAALGHSVLGIDIDARLISIANKRSAEMALSSIHFSEMNATDLKAGNESFDIALLPWSLQFVEDPLKAISEVHRVLKPNGQMLLIGYLTEGDYHEIVETFVPNLPAINSREQYSEPIDAVFGQVERNLFFESRHSFNYCFQSIDIASEAFLFAFRFWYKRELVAEEQKLLRDLLSCRLSDGKVRLSFPAMLASARKAT